MSEKVQVTREDSKTPSAEPAASGPVFSPRVDIIERPEGMVILADMPGVSKDTVSVVLEKGVLTIDGDVPENAEAGLTLQVQEYEVGHFHRAFEVGESLDPGGVEATMRDGVLRLAIPTREDVRPRRIEIK